MPPVHAMKPHEKRAWEFDVSWGSDRIWVRDELRELHSAVRERYIQLSDAHARALYDWARDNAKAINAILREEGPDLDLSGACYRQHVSDRGTYLWEITALDEFMVELPNAMTAYRGVDHFDALAGDVWTDPAYTSTTWDVNVAKRFARGQKGTKLEVPRSRPTLVHLHLPAGTPVCPIGLTPQGFRRECELVIARGVSFEIESVRDLRGLHHVHATARA